MRSERVTKMLKVPPKAPKSEPKSRSLSETVLSDAVGIVPTASLMRNDLLNTLPVAGVLRGERVIKMLKKTPKGIQNRGR